MDECGQYYISARRVAAVLAEAGHDVRIIAFMGENTPSYEETKGYKVLRVNVITSRIPKLRFVRALTDWLFKSQRGLSPLPSDPKVSRGTTRLDSRSRPVLQSCEPSPPERLVSSFFKNSYWFLFRIAVYFLYLEYYWRSFWLARRQRADVCHAHDLNAVPVAWACSRLFRGRLVYDAHELWLDRERLPPRSRLNRLLVKKLESFFVRRADATIIAGVSSGRELARRYNIEPLVVHNAWYYRPYEPSSLLRDEMGISSEKKILLYIGVINLYRGLEVSVQSLKHLPNCVLVILGWGPPDYVAALKSFISDEGLTDRVYFHEPVAFDRITNYGMSADVGLILMKNVGLNYYYVSPNKVFQHMVAGLPTVSSNFPDLKIFVEGYDFGVTCDPESPRDIANSVNYILADQARYSQMRANALEAARTYNWENEARKIVDLYEGLRAKR